ncbi:unnamed protein product [Acanthoscelides obtectus]|uniref:Protein NDNF n=2 Tax=Acanthoscelides obtectus TaxID=200917 RepID=A0A9P0K3H8_ACAOB|nr:unnamed protein product [Acanthoscelides obtectus]CAK1647252.1 Protein NDNF [Acanthoscelides obtectus]
MMLIVQRRLLFLLFFLIKLTECNRKNRRYKELRRPEPYDVFDSDYLPSDVQVATYLYKGITKRFYYQSTVSNSTLSVTISTCTGPVEWLFETHERRLAVKNSDKHTRTHNLKVSTGMSTSYFPAVKGLYMLQLLAQEMDTYVHIYVSTEEGGPKTIQSARLQKIKIIQRQRRKGVTLRWRPSLVDPQSTTYCAVVHDQKTYGSLCAAQADKFGILPPVSRPVAASQTVISWQPSTQNHSTRTDDTFPIIGCVGRSTQYTTLNLKQGKNYYFQVFATDGQNNFTYPYGSASLIFDGRVKPIRLKNGISAYANLKKYDGKVVFRYKIPKNPGKQLKVIIIPCGSVVYVEVLKKGSVIVAKRNVLNYEKITIDSPTESSRYYIKVFAVERAELDKSAGIEILASTKQLSKALLPPMPHTTSLNEYKPLRTCDSVTIGWIPVPGRAVSHYCISAREGELEQVNSMACPAKNGKIMKADDYVVKYCKDIAQSDNFIAKITIFTDN